MILSGLEIKRQIHINNISISDFDEKRLSPNSYNLRLDNKLLVAPKELDMAVKPEFIEREIPIEGTWLTPGNLYLGKTIERTHTDKFVPMIEGRSSIGRLGLFIHITAGFGDIGFDGNWTLEIVPTIPIKIYSGIEICQIFYHTIQGEVKLYKSDKYQGQTEITPSKLWKEFI